jgi:hypothetical protein
MPKENIRFSFDGRNMTINFKLDKDKQYTSGHDYWTPYQKKIYLPKEEWKQFSRPLSVWKLKQVTVVWKVKTLGATSSDIPAPQ